MKFKIYTKFWFIFIVHRKDIALLQIGPFQSEKFTKLIFYLPYKCSSETVAS